MRNSFVCNQINYLLSRKGIAKLLWLEQRWQFVEFLLIIFKRLKNCFPRTFRAKAKRLPRRYSAPSRKWSRIGDRALTISGKTPQINCVMWDELVHLVRPGFLNRAPPSTWCKHQVEIMLSFIRWLWENEVTSAQQHDNLHHLWKCFWQKKQDTWNVNQFLFL